jgi:hypothetical protein
MKKTISEKIVDLIIQYPKRILFLGILFGVITIPGIQFVKSNYSVRIWFPISDPLIQRLDEFEAKFGNDEKTVTLIYHPDGIFTPEGLKVIEEFTESAWLWPYVVRVDSLINYNYTEVNEDDLNISPFIDTERMEDPDYINQRKEIALKDKDIPDYLIDKNGQIALIHSRLRPGVSDKTNINRDVSNAVYQTEEELKKKYPGFEFHHTGTTVVSNSFRKANEDDMAFMLPVLMLVIISLLIYSFRRTSGVLFPLGLILYTVVILFGMMGWMGVQFNNMLSILPGTMTAICIADTVHILVSFFQNRAKGLVQVEAARNSLYKNFIPTLLTSVSTSIGFFSLAPTNMIPVRDLGIMAGVGSILAWVMTFLIIGPLIVLTPLKKDTRFHHENIKDLKPSERALKIVAWIKRYSLGIISGFVLVTGVALFFGLKNEVNSDPFGYFTDDYPISISNKFILKHVGGAGGPEFVLSSGEAEGIKDPEFLRKVEKLENWIMEMPEVSKTISVLSIIKRMNEQFNGNNPEFYKIPDSRRTVAELLFLYTISLPQGMGINDRVTVDNESIRMTVFWNLRKSNEVIERIKQIEEKSKELGLDGYVSGKIPLYQMMNSYIVETFYKSIALALTLVSILMIILFRSFKLGLLSMLPNIIPLTIGSAVVYLTGKYVDMGTALVTSVTLGIAVDDTIHFLSHYNKEIKNGKTPEEAVGILLTYTGPALLYTTVILVAGFGVFVFSKFVPNINFGMLCAIVLTMALITDLIFLPALLIRFSKANQSS